MAEDDVFTEYVDEEEEPEKRKSGPGFVLGVMFGALAGAAAATLFAPATGEELRQYVGEEASHQPGEEGEPQSPMEQVRALLARVRSRVQEASEEGRLAAQEAEEAGRARYAELTHQES